MSWSVRTRPSVSKTRSRGLARVLPPSGSLRVALLGAVFTLVSLTLVTTDVSEAEGTESLEKRWMQVLQRQGVLTNDGPLLEFRVGLPGSEGSAQLMEVSSDAVVFRVQRDRQTWEKVVPIGRIALEVRRY